MKKNKFQTRCIVLTVRNKDLNAKQNVKNVNKRIFRKTTKIEDLQNQKTFMEQKIQKLEDDLRDCRKRA